MKYLATVTGQSADNEKMQILATLSFDDHKRLISFQLEGDITDASHKYLLDLIPCCEEEMNESLAKRKNVKIDVIPEDLSFEKFWLIYDFKFGSKSRAERLWNHLNFAERMKAIRHLSQYDRYLKMNPGIAKAHASTYLNQERWNN